ncbi:MAG: hypothetical protein MUO31_02360 [Thermodesulfovibrionales bacterium]|nr:hypothetical protein [Thermodesulfovibrionales bacterium]
MSWYSHSHKTWKQLDNEDKKGRFCDVCEKQATNHCTKKGYGFFFCHDHMMEFMNYDRSIAMMKRDNRLQRKHDQQP